VSSKPIPERSPVGDAFTGFVLEFEGRQALSLSAQADMEILFSGDFIIRYGLRYLGKLHISVVPGLVALDYGDFLVGETAWEFLTKNSNLYPRSEVIGYRNDGSDEMIVIKALDIGIPPEVLVYDNALAVKPIAKPIALIAADDAKLPSRLLEFLPRFATLSEWQTVL
jgi:hypothetical protein